MTAVVCASSAEAVAGIENGQTILIGGFGMAGMPVALVDALIDQGADDLTVVSNNAGSGDTGLAALLAKGRVRKVICSFPRQSDSWVFDGLYRAGRIELEVVPPAPWPSDCGPPAPASARSTARPPWVLRWLRARRPGKSTVVATCWSTRCGATSP